MHGHQNVKKLNFIKFIIRDMECNFFCRTRWPIIPETQLRNYCIRTAEALTVSSSSQISIPRNSPAYMGCAIYTNC